LTCIGVGKPGIPKKTLLMGLGVLTSAREEMNKAVNALVAEGKD
jgi:hypothetical protein